MPVSASVSITCKHLLIICEQMLAFGLFPSVIPSGGLCLATSLHRDVLLTFSPSWQHKLSGEKKYICEQFLNELSKRSSSGWKDQHPAKAGLFSHKYKKVCSGSCTACVPPVVIQGCYCGVHMLIWASSIACQRGVQWGLQTHPGTRVDV